MGPVFHPAGSPYEGRMRSLTGETAAGAVRTYTWDNLEPGTYLYHSASHMQVQVQMGLYGALRMDAPGPAGSRYAYPGTPYGQDVVLLYSELDPGLHQAVATNNYGPGKPVTSTIDYRPQYFLISVDGAPGEPYTAGRLPVPVGDGGGRVLLRFLNAGLQTHVPVMQGLYLDVIAEDGNPYPYARTQYSLKLPAAKTKDALLSPDCGAAITAGDYAVYDARMRLTNAANPGGGMLIHLQVADGDGDGVVNVCDNCIQVANADQRDTNGDGYGNICDADLNNDGVVNGLDVGILKGQFLTPGPDADFNGDGVVNGLDVGILKGLFLQPPGPSGLAP